MKTKSFIFLVAMTFGVCPSLFALEVGGSATQYGGSFVPNVGEHGGFGGCSSNSATKTPVIFIHGNGDTALSFDKAPTGPNAPSHNKSVYDYLKDTKGYTDCELFGVTYLSSTEISLPANNYHRPAKYNIITDFIDEVLTYTGKSTVDIVGHSLGVTMTLAGLKYNTKFSKVRRFINIAGALKGLQSCLWMGAANPAATTCGSENWVDGYVFGFFPGDNTVYPYYNTWTSDNPTWGLRNVPENNTGVDFYTIYAGFNDEVHCATLLGFVDCSQGPLFDSNSNVKSQINVGAGSKSYELDWNFEDNMPTNLLGGDADGVGHVRALTNTAEIIWKMLDSTCTDDACSGTYSGPANTTETVAVSTWHRVNLSAAANKHVIIRISGLNADVDLYVRKGSDPTLSTYDCRPYYSGTTSETCVFDTTQSETFHIGVYGYNTGDFVLKKIEQADRLKVSNAAWYRTTIVAAAGDDVVNIALTNLGIDQSSTTYDVDLYVRKGSEPTTSTYDCRSVLSGNASETCQFDNTAATTYHIGVYGYDSNCGTDACRFYLQKNSVDID
tara:strand:- start:1510 stop:3174 length:1665 start_codon:yes stop_codon:yes gene_type:complete